MNFNESMSGFIDITGLFSDNDGAITEYDYCIPVGSIREVVNDRNVNQTVIRYEIEKGSISHLAVGEDYGIILDKIRATGSKVS